MAFDRNDTEYHLTPDGWVMGTDLYFGKGEKTDPPSDRVETWLRHMVQRSGWSREEISWSLKWFNESISEKDRLKLRAKFAPPERDFSAG